MASSCAQQAESGRNHPMSDPVVLQPEIQQSDVPGLAEQIVAIETFDVRFPTSTSLDGSDAMNPTPDYSAAYVVLRTSTGAEGHSLVFTIGRGTDVQLAAVEALAPLVVGRDVEAVVGDLGSFSR